MIDYNDLTKNIKDGLKFPTGATSERGTPSKGSLRFNSETGKPEIYAKSRGWKTEASSGSSAAYITADLVVDLDAGNPNSYSGSGNTWTDLKGNMDMTFSNGSNFTHNSSGWFDSNGAGTWYNPSWSFNLLSNGIMTIDTWIKFNSLSYGGNYFLETRGNTSKILLIKVENYSTPKIYVYYRGDNAISISDDDFNVLDWNHLSFVVDDDGTYSYFTLYVNGVASNAGTKSFYSGLFLDNSSITRFLTLGAYSSGSYAGISNISDMNIASFRLYDSALSSSDIASNFNNTKSRFGL